MIKAENINYTKNPVTCNDNFQVEVSIFCWEFISKNMTFAQAENYTYSQLTKRMIDMPNPNIEFLEDTTLWGGLESFTWATLS